jgi:hypothetical protein
VTDSDGVLDTATRRWARRLIVITFILLQVGFVMRAYRAPHAEFGYQMFPESSTWSAEVVRVTPDGRRISVQEPWSGYEWSDLVQGRGLTRPWSEHHADSGLDRQLAFLGEALDWVARNTPSDTETSYLEATVTSSRNGRPAETTTIRSSRRDVP